MKNKIKYNANQMFNFAQGSYLERTSRPVYAIFFLLPFILFYELGMSFINADSLIQPPIVAFAWLQEAVKCLGLSSKFAWMAPPMIVILILFAQQITSRKKWNFWIRDIFPMGFECILLAIPLIVLTMFLTSSTVQQTDIDQQSYSIRSTLNNETAGSYCLQSVAQSQSESSQPQSLLPKIITSIGAGIYEELVFRLILICILMIILQDILRLEFTQSMIISVFLSAALFSAYHNIDFITGQINYNDTFNWTKFTFRTLAGIYFAALFAIRGFGITAGTHAFYDIIAVCIDSFLFRG